MSLDTTVESFDTVSFVRDLALALGVDTFRIVILSVQPASIVVEFYFLEPTGGDTGPSAQGLVDATINIAQDASHSLHNTYPITQAVSVTATVPAPTSAAGRLLGASLYLMVSVLIYV